MRLAESLWIDLCGKARGDCWWLVAEVFRRRGVALVGFDAERFDDWREADAPTAGDVVLFVRDGRSHVGVMLDGAEYLHATKGRVLVSRLASLRRAGVAYRVIRHHGVGVAPVAPESTGVRVVYVPDPVGRPTERQTWYRAPGTIGECAPAGANVVMTADGPRVVSEVADRPAPSSVVYATAPEGTEFVIGLIITILSTVISLALAPKPTSAKQDDPYPTFDGVRNTAASGIVQPVVYGAHRTAGNFISAVQRVDADGRSVFYGLILLSRGPVQSIGGLTADADDLSGPAIPDSIEIDGNPARNYDAKVSVRLGGYDQTTVPGFSETATTESIGANVDIPPDSANWANAQPWARTTAQAVTGFDVLLTYPAGLIGYVTSSGAPFSITVSYTVRWRVNGATTWTSETWTHTGQRNAQISYQFSKRGLTKDVYEIQLQFLSASVPVFGSSPAQVLAMNEIVAQGFQYPGCALLGVRLVGSDQLAGGVPTITAQVEGRKVWVYDGAGGFSQAYTRNPAWIVLDILTSKDYGLGRGGAMTVDQINLDEFDDFADWCDELVDDGRSGTFARAVCDHVASDERSGWELAVEIVQSAFARLYYAGGQARIWIDRTTSPSFMFTAGNSRDVKVAWNGRRDRFNAAEVQYLNSETDYEGDYATKLDDSEVLTSGAAIRKQPVGATGVTRAGQAYRLAQRLVNVNRYVKRRASWISGPESVHLSPGAVVYLHGSALGAGMGGRILDATSSTVKLDRTVTVSTRVRLDVYAQDDTAPTVVYINAGTYARNTAITIRDSGGTATTWSATPAAGSKWIVASLTTASTAPVAFRVETMRTSDAMDVTFEASEYVADVYSDDPGDVEEFTDQLPDPRAMPASVTGLRATDAALVSCDGCVSDAIRVAFQTVEAWQTGEVWYRSAGSAGWIFHGWSRGDALIPVACGTYEVAVAARSARGTVQRLADAATAAVEIRGRRTAPDAPTTVVGTVTAGGILHLTIDGPDGAEYQIRYGSDWAGSILVAERSGPKWSGACPFTGAETIRVRTISRTGVTSDDEVADIATWTTADSVFTADLDADQNPGWAGDLDDLTIDGTGLLLDGSALTGTYETDLLAPADTAATQQVVVTVRGALDDVAMTWDEASFAWGSALAEDLTWATSYLTGREVAALDSPTWDQAGFTWGGLQGSLRTWAGPTDVVAALTPTVVYDIDEALSFPTYETPPVVAGIATVCARVTMRRPHERYEPRVATMNVASFDLSGGGGGSAEVDDTMSAVVFWG